ncbi:acyltransferase family protein [Terriglobus roseus]|uniref:Peptidoglycan/LPS O-acetylase OafA/YrhL, contains acyltransferase and SGNH-hydrolase domains n=1 Tax=Terriglobus roseus TaxID=392734 RepID=A0A1H4QXV2_9BACT|nr:acyltransferase [Terriglobus roseus]SEC24291.1 Peptidoglycan/LPS O-acetylase OafA/YrhL, contains acyltransferase and SGNH-hydrolase domains [Terriglobus roseus]
MQGDRIRTHEEAELLARTPKGRLFQLDALRGIAAFFVMWYHLRYAYPPFHTRNPIVFLFTSGRQSVILFFVLSGYVLGMPYWRGRETPYRRYLLRRFFRIYVPFLVALIFAWVCADHFLYSHLPLTPWFYKTWQTPLTGGLFVRQLFMSNDATINTAFWSLRIEAEFSILLPLCCSLVRRLPAIGTLLLCVVSYAGSMYTHQEGLAQALTNFPMFFLGLLLSLHAERIAQVWRRFHPAAHCVVLAFAMLLYLHVLPAKFWADALTGIGAALIIVCSLHSAWITRLLRHSLPEYLGRISYSLYLVHGTVLFATLNLLYGRVSTWLVGLCYGLTTFVFAHLLCILIEEPSMRLGRKLTT